jgi:alkanesulfonate monooxygenase SsuD/methylene tetrahydromethanopterin reductase-like flavin-dependent oxidoreductase (luciferase family)
MRFDMRAPDFGAPATEVYEAAVDMCAWAETRGCLAAVLRRLLAGESVQHEGRRIRVTPSPSSPQGPLMMWGGGSLATARRAGRYGLGYLSRRATSPVRRRRTKKRAVRTAISPV